MSSAGPLKTVMVLAALLAAGPSLLAQQGTAEKLLVLTDGRVVAGQIVLQPGGHLVQSATGSIFIPEEQVQVVAENLVDAYRQQRDSVIKPTPLTRYTLAKWCVTYRLYDEARDELKLALQQNGEFDEARRFLARINDVLDPPKALNAVAPPPKSRDGFVVPDVESLGGLSKLTAAQFSARIQPLLINKCGNAGCHGPQDPQEFRLTAPRAGSTHRITSEQNLASVMQQIDVQRPFSSPLMLVPREPHGGLAWPVFSGSAGAAQERILKTWLKQIAYEKRDEAEDFAARPSLRRKPEAVLTEQAAAESEPEIVQTSGTAPATGFAIPKRSSTPPTPLPLPPDVVARNITEIQPGRDPAADEASPAPRYQDAFDPEEFNRLVHGMKSNRP